MSRRKFKISAADELMFDRTSERKEITVAGGGKIWVNTSDEECMPLGGFKAGEKAITPDNRPCVVLGVTYLSAGFIHSGKKLLWILRDKRDEATCCIDPLKDGLRHIEENLG